MIKKDTIIIGGGISGLFCANKLKENDEDFLLITKEIGGRINFSKENPNINFGGVYLTTSYKNLLPYIEKIEKFKPLDFYFEIDGKFVSLLNIKVWKYYYRIFRFLILLIRFSNHLDKFRDNAKYRSQKELISKDKLLYKYWNLPVETFLKENNFENLDKLFGVPTAGTNFFTHSKNLNTFYYLFLFITMIKPAFIVKLDKTLEILTKDIEDKIKIDQVYKIEKKDNKYIVKTKENEYLSKNVVICAPYKDMVNIIDVPKPKLITSTYVLRVSGIRRKKIKNKKGLVFNQKHDIYLIWRQKNGEEVIYSKVKEPNLNYYFESYKILENKFWDTAAQLAGDNLLDQEIDKNLYLASDYNFSLMEDACITGIYAANQIRKNK